MPRHNDAEPVFIELGALVAAMPDLRVTTGSGQPPDSTLTWLADLGALLPRLGTPGALLAADLNVDSAMLISTSGGAAYATKIKLTAMRALAVARANSPAGARGAFVPTGADFDAFAALSQVMKTAKTTLLIVDPYLDESALSKFAILANEGVSIALLADENGIRPGLAPAAAAWIAQYGKARHLQVRSAPPRTLHDRAILVDGQDAWILTQSLKDFAARSPATIQHVDRDLALMKFEAYSTIWDNAAVIAETA